MKVKNILDLQATYTWVEIVLYPYTEKGKWFHQPSQYCGENTGYLERFLRNLYLLNNHSIEFVLRRVTYENVTKIPDNCEDVKNCLMTIKTMLDMALKEEILDSYIAMFTHFITEYYKFLFGEDEAYDILDYIMSKEPSLVISNIKKREKDRSNEIVEFRKSYKELMKYKRSLAA